MHAPAHAGAWSLPAGSQQWIASVSRETGDFGESWRAEDYTEFGMGDGWAFNAKVESEIRISDIYDDRSGVRLGIQKAFALGERASFSVQASALAGESLDGPECPGGGYEARAAIGTSFVLWGREGYVNAEAGRRERGNCARTSAELALGLSIADDWALGLKAWQDGGGDTGSTKTEVSLTRYFGGIGVGLGWREEVSGNFSQRGWLVTAQARF